MTTLEIMREMLYYEADFKEWVYKLNELCSL